MLTRLPGIILALVISLIAIWLSHLTGIGDISLALLIGLLIGNLWSPGKSFGAGLAFTEKRILETAIVLMGFGLSVSVLEEVSIYVWLIIAASLVLVFGFGLLVSKYSGLGNRMGILLGAGSAICGTSAIAAVAPLIKSTEEETGLSIGVINFLGTIGLLLLPLLAGVVDFSVEQSAFLIGGTLQSMGHVSGAGFSLGTDTGTLAILIKMGRILGLVPLLILLYINGTRKTEAAKAGSFPWFILMFILAVILAQFSFMTESIREVLSISSDYLLIMAMSAIGFNIKIRPMLKLAAPALIAGIIIFAMQIGMFLLATFLLFGNGF